MVFGLNVNMEKVYDYMPILFMMSGMAINFMTMLPKEFRSTASLFSLIGAVGWIAAIEIGFRLKASEYTYIRMICRPSQKTLHLWIQEPKEGIRGRRIPGTNDYHTPLDLAEPVDYGMFEGVEAIDLIHEWQWEERIVFTPGKAVYKGYPLQHAKTATIVVWEPQEDDTRLEFGVPIPRFMLESAPRDWFLMTDPPVITRPDGKNAEMTDEDQKNINWKTRYENEHRIRIRDHGFVESLRNEWEGAISRSRDVTKLVKEEIVTLLAAHATLEGAAGELTQKNWFLFGRNVALIIIATVGVFMFAMRPDLRAWISEHVVFFIIMGIIAVAGIYYWRKR